MLAHMLDGHGIAAHVLGEQLQGGVGELPAGGFIKLMVADEDHAQARALILEWERLQPASDPTTPSKRFGGGMAAGFIGVGILVGGSAHFAYVQSGLTFAGSKMEQDQNDDGRTDLTYFYQADGVFARRLEADNNFDGRVDIITHFDAQGEPTRETIDENFDGVFETKFIFEHGTAERSETDTNGDGVPDILRTYYSGVIAREDFRDTMTGHVARTNHYNGGLLQRAEVDSDRDGFAETLRTFDRFGEITSEEIRQRPAN